MPRFHFFIFLAASCFLLFLIAFNKLIEPLTITDADALSDIIFKENANSSVIKDVQDLNIKDDNIVFILKSEIDDDQKLIKLKSYMCELISKRNETDKYVNISPQEKLTCKDFIKVLNVVGSKDSEYNIDYTNKVNEFKSLLLNDKSFNSVLNSTETDQVKFMGPGAPNFISLTNEILLGPLAK